jgi:hypothetical protein
MQPRVNALKFLPNKLTETNHILLYRKPYALPHKCKRDFLSGAQFNILDNIGSKVTILDRFVLMNNGIRYAVIYAHKNLPPFFIDLENPFPDDVKEHVYGEE